MTRGCEQVLPLAATGRCAAPDRDGRAVVWRPDPLQVGGLHVEMFVMHGPLRAPPAPRRRGPSDQDAGFTLIELLVVVVILGILAAIAVPTYTSMRRRAWDAATKSELRNAAVAVESYVNANAGRYPSDGYSGPPNYTGCNGELCTELTLSAPFRWENGGFLDYNPVTPAGYCIMASHQSQLSRIWALHSSTGVPVLAQCDAAGNLV